VITLAIESSSTQLGAALVGDDVAPCSFEAPGARRHTELLGPVIAFVLDAGGVSLSGLDGIVVDVGPGLFTGLRTGVASAKGLALGSGLPIVGVRSTAALRRAASQFPGAVAAALDVRRGEVAYEFPADDRARIGGLSELFGGLEPLVEEGDVLLVGNGWNSLGEELLARYGAKISFAGPEFDTPSAVIVGRLGLEELHAGRHSSAMALEVDYLREPDVAINWSTRITSGA
jgi:tRNA threonylcarbamoyladenosine biosynthesis protein TsaB